MNPDDWKPEHEDADTDDDLDVQVHPTGASITVPERMIDENLPGQINLDMEEVGRLRDLVNEAWFIGWGLQPMSIPAGDIRKGDIIPCLGLTVSKPFPLAQYPDIVVIQFGQNHEMKRMQLPRYLEVTVHRRIE